jgi:AraC-like DNA-binding protein
LSVAKHEIGAPANARFLSLHRALDQGTSSGTIDNLLAGCMESVASGCVVGDFAGDVPAEMVRGAHAHLLHNLAQRVTLSDLAAATGYGKWSLIAAFGAEVRVPPIQYLMQLRVARARALLRAGRPCSDVASEVGFFDQSHFNRWFRRTYGITPGQYQRTFAGT